MHVRLGKTVHLMKAAIGEEWALVLTMTRFTALLGEVHAVWKAHFHLWSQNLQKHIEK